jgi:hypothetical protein
VIYTWNRDAYIFKEIVYNHDLVLDLFLSPRFVYLPRKREANKDTAIGLAISNGDAKVK